MSNEKLESEFKKHEEKIKLFQKDGQMNFLKIEGMRMAINEIKNKIREQDNEFCEKYGLEKASDNDLFGE